MGFTGSFKKGGKASTSPIRQKNFVRHSECLRIELCATLLRGHFLGKTLICRMRPALSAELLTVRPALAWPLPRSSSSRSDPSSRSSCVHGIPSFSAIAVFGVGSLKRASFLPLLGGGMMKIRASLLRPSRLRRRCREPSPKGAASKVSLLRGRPCIRGWREGPEGEESLTKCPNPGWPTRRSGEQTEAEVAN